MDQLHARAGRLTHLIEQLVAGSAGTSVPEDDRRAHAEMLLALCGSAARIAVREWSEGNDDDTTHIEGRAVALVEQIRGTLP